MSEQELIRKIIAGDQSALSRFYLTYKNRLTFFIGFKVASKEDIDEILQDTLLDTLEALRDFTGKSSIYTFMCAIAKRKIVDFYRKQKIKNVLFSQLPEDFKALISRALNPEEEYCKIEDQILVKMILLKLKPVYSKALQLKYAEGFSVKEIAQNLSLSIKSVESILVRAKRSFIQQYQFLETK